MKHKFCILLTLLTLSVTVISFQSCVKKLIDETSEALEGKKYTVWTAVMTYAEYRTILDKEIKDGYYLRSEMTDEQWSWVRSNLINAECHSWSENTICKWFYGNGLGLYDSRETSWLILTNHGFEAIRQGNVVHFILK